MNNLEDFKRRLTSKNKLAKEVLNSEEYKVSRLIFKKRMEIGLTQQELAKKANVTQKTISRIEGADKGVRQSTLSKVFAALDINADSLVINQVENTKDELTATL